MRELPVLNRPSVVPDDFRKPSNMGIGLAQACRYPGLRFICVVDPRTAEQNLRVLRTYGAEVDVVTEPDPALGELLQARLNRVHGCVPPLRSGHPRGRGWQAGARRGPGRGPWS